jgi:hypothetical protein
MGKGLIYYTCKAAALRIALFLLGPFIFFNFYFFSVFTHHSIMLFASIPVIVSFLFAFSTLVTAAPSGKKKAGAVVSGLGIPVSNPDAKDVIANSYIVVYHKNCTDAMMEDHVNQVKTAMKKRRIGARSTDGRVLSGEVSAISMMGWRAMAVEAEDAMIIDIAGSPMVTNVEADTRVNISAMVKQTNAPLGLERLSHKAISTDGYAFDASAGTGITVYVVDTGIRTTHTVSFVLLLTYNLANQSLGLWWQSNLRFQ